MLERAAVGSPRGDVEAGEVDGSDNEYLYLDDFKLEKYE